MASKIICAGFLACFAAPALADSPPASSTAVAIDPGFIQLMGGFGPVGQKSGEHELSSAGAQVFEFKDGSRLVVKHTAFDPGNATVQVLVGHGRAGLSLKLAQSTWALPILPLGGTAGATVKEIEAWLGAAGHAATFNVVPMTEAFAFTGTSSSTDIGYEIAAMCGMARNAGFGEDLGQRLKQAAAEYPTHIESNAGLVFSRTIQRAAVGAGARYSELPLRSELAADPIVDLQQIVDREMSGPFDISVVGDVDPQQVATFVAQTCAAGRSAQSPRTRMSVSPHFQTGSRTVTFEHTAVSGTKGYQGLFWSAAKVVADQNEATALDVLGGVLKVRLSMKLSTASRRVVPVVGGGSPQDLPFGGYFGIGVEVADLKGKPLSSWIGDELIAIAHDPQAYGQVNALKAAKVQDQDAHAKSNFWWALSLGYSLSDPEVLDRFLRRSADLQAVTVQDVVGVGNKLAQDRARLAVMVRPDK